VVPNEVRREDLVDSIQVALAPDLVMMAEYRRLRLSQAAFARQADISRNSLVDYERGDRVPKTAPLARIAEAGGSSVDWLLNGRLPHVRVREDPEWEAALRALSAAWRDPTRRRLAIKMLAALGRK
jgi:transcriptional regulator with XRE-family HTH domain